MLIVSHAPLSRARIAPSLVVDPSIKLPPSRPLMCRVADEYTVWPRTGQPLTSTRNPSTPRVHDVGDELASFPSPLSGMTSPMLAERSNVALRAGRAVDSGALRLMSRIGDEAGRWRSTVGAVAVELAE